VCIWFLSGAVLNLIVLFTIMVGHDQCALIEVTTTYYIVGSFRGIEIRTHKFWGYVTIHEFSPMKFLTILAWICWYYNIMICHHSLITISWVCFNFTITWVHLKTAIIIWANLSVQSSSSVTVSASTGTARNLITFQAVKPVAMVLVHILVINLDILSCNNERMGFTIQYILWL